ncbi:hypothetical protein L1987_64219 [Smallanthus sonchifolius]|uniref:Uncharacterized protein n=1 Tax=Smallanthus sonchifolius TaxID=185202 RepID=A0ACB9CFI8_9ASTR|nr:hypothetical protein L1987_64219 [Smallanthus sonchifolius]
MGALDESHCLVVLENGFETLTGDVNKSLGKSPLCVGKALCEGNGGHEEEFVNISACNGVCSHFQKCLIIFYSTKCDLQVI